MKRFLKYGILGLLVVILIGGIVVWQVWARAINAAVTTAVEKYGPELTGTQVKLEHVSISPFTGSGSITGFLVGNPEGFKTDRSFKLDNVHVSLDLSSLLSDTIVVNDIVVDGAEITYELSFKGSNIARIMTYVDAAAAKGADETPKADEPAAASDSSSTKVIIDHFLLDNTGVRLSATVAQGKAATVPLPKIELKEIGRKKLGVTVGEAIQQIMAPISKAVAAVAAKIGANSVGGGGLDNAKEAIDGGVSKLKGLLGK